MNSERPDNVKDAHYFSDESSSTVTIIGAGPVGLYAALLLAQVGIDVDVFEREPFILQSPRAIAYYPVVLEDFKRAGIFDDVVKAGFKNTIGASWRKPKNGGKLAHIGGDDPHKFAIHLGQYELANIILDHLGKFPNVKVHFDRCLEHLENLSSGDRIRAHFIRGPEQATTSQHISRFLIGADGGRSTVRKLLGIPLEGFTWNDFNIVAANIVYDMETLADWGPANFVVDPVLWSVVAKTGKGPNWRVATGEKSVEGDILESWDEEKAKARLRKRLELLLPGPTEKAEIVKISPYKMHQRCVPTFRQGNVLLAGDAAHLTNPVGGLGLTTGLMDSSLLACVLEQILVQGQPSTLLDSYAKTRRDIFMNYTNPTATANRQRLLGTDPETQKEREDLFAKINKPDHDFLQRMYEAELGISSTRHEKGE